MWSYFQGFKFSEAWPSSVCLDNITVFAVYVAILVWKEELKNKSYNIA